MSDKKFVDNSFQHFLTMASQEGMNSVVLKLTKIMNKNRFDDPLVSKKAQSMILKLKNNSKKLSEEYIDHKTVMFLMEYLNENGVMLSGEMLTESKKHIISGEIVSTILNNISDKVESDYLIDIFKSKGDIKNYKYLNDIQEAIQILEMTVDEYGLKDSRFYLDKIISAFVNINKYSNEYKDAFRNKKIFLMLHYAGLLLSIVTCVAYLLSVTCTVSPSGEVIPKNPIKIDKILSFTALDTYNKHTSDNTFKNSVRDVAMMRESMSELSAEDLFSLTESDQMLDVIISGARNIYDKIRQGPSGNILRMIYKTAGIILIVRSIRDSFYTTFRMNNKINDMIEYIKDFINSRMVNTGHSKINNLSKFIAVDIESASDNAKNDIIDEDRMIIKNVDRIEKEQKERAVETTIEDDSFTF